MITLGLVLLICGILLGSAPLAWLGGVLTVVGLAALLLGAAGPIAGRWW